MNKVQKTIMIDPELYALVRALEEKHGTSFARLINASLLSYLFCSYSYRDHNQSGLRYGADSDWMRIAVMLERGDLTVPDLPEALIDGTIQTAEKLIAANMSPDLAKRVLAVFKKKRQIWDNGVADFGGKMQAIIDFLVE